MPIPRRIEAGKLSRDEEMRGRTRKRRRRRVEGVTRHHHQSFSQSGHVSMVAIFVGLGGPVGLLPLQPTKAHHHAHLPMILEEREVTPMMSEVH